MGAIGDHEAALSTGCTRGCAPSTACMCWGRRRDVETLAVATFTVEGMHHGLVAARLSAEFGIGVRHGCFCAHPYLLRLLGVGAAGVAEARAAVLRGDRSWSPVRSRQLRARDLGR